MPRFQDRFLGFVWVAVAFTAPTVEPFDLDKTIATLQQAVGSGIYGYWKLLCRPNGHKLCEDHVRGALS